MGYLAARLGPGPAQPGGPGRSYGYGELQRGAFQKILRRLGLSGLGVVVAISSVGLQMAQSREVLCNSSKYHLHTWSPEYLVLMVLLSVFVNRLFRTMVARLEGLSVRVAQLSRLAWMVFAARVATTFLAAAFFGVIQHLLSYDTISWRLQHLLKGQRSWEEGCACAIAELRQKANGTENCHVTSLLRPRSCSVMSYTLGHEQGSFADYGPP